MELIGLLETPDPVFEYISDAKVRDLQNSPAWDVMFSSEYFDFDSMIKLRALILNIRDQLNQVRVNI